MNKIIIVRHTPIDVDLKMFECFAQEFWHYGVEVYAETHFDPWRKNCGYQETTNYISTYIMDRDNIQLNEIFFKNNNTNFFLFYGLTLANKYIDSLTKNKVKFGIISERDISLIDPNFKNLIKKNILGLNYFKYRKVINYLSCFLAMGELGVNCFNKFYRVPKKKIFNFMYNDGNDFIYPYINSKGPIKLVYVGRFDCKYKGIDTLLNAFDKSNNDLLLDFIGDYGDDYELVKQHSQNNNRINILGIVNRESLCSFLNKYDLIVVPSKRDGWNLHCNIGINAGIGVICSNQSVSHELIKSCQNGIVIPSNNEKALLDVLNELSYEQIEKWKMKNIQYNKKISYLNVANYLNSVFRYTFTKEISKKPIEPWNLYE